MRLRELLEQHIGAMPPAEEWPTEDELDLVIIVETDLGSHEVRDVRFERADGKLVLEAD